jgi:hypothetical protein
MRSTEPIEVPPYLCTMSAIVVLNWRKSRAARRLMRRVPHVVHVLQQKRASNMGPGGIRIFAIDDLSVTTKRGCRARKVRSRAKGDSSGQKRVFWTEKLLERRYGKPVNVPDQGLKHKLERANRRGRRCLEGSKR